MSKIITADAIIGLKQIPDNSVDMCVTSPPYYCLRNYGVDGQIGLEETPEEYVNRLVLVFREVRRVLKPNGTLWLNIGDSYAGSRKGHTNGKSKDAQENRRNSHSDLFAEKPQAYGCKPKDLIGVPWTVAFALRADGYYLRQDIIWYKPNCMPESVRDRCTKSHEHIFLLSKEPRYYFDAEAISEPVTESTIRRMKQGVYSEDRTPKQPEVPPRFGGKKYTEHPDIFSRTKSGRIYEYKPLRNKRDVWAISNRPFSGAHFATFPPDLVRTCILAGSQVGGIVLDPFFGSGTTGLVAQEEGRDYIGIDINPAYTSLAKKRLGITDEEEAKR